jgi:hypothetical protein
VNPEQLAKAVEGALNDPDFYSHLQGGQAGVERTDRHGPVIIVHFDNGQALMLQAGRVPDPRYL